MPTSIQKTSNFLNNDKGFSLLEILIALVLAAMIFMAIPSGDNVQKHRDLKSAVDDLDRASRFASNEAVLRNTVTRLVVSFDTSPPEYSVEFGPPGNMPLPAMSEKLVKTLDEEKAESDKISALDKQFNKVPEFDEIKHELSQDVTVIGVGTTSQKKITTEGKAFIYFYPTGEKDGAIIFFSTIEELAYLEIQPFMTETDSTFEVIKARNTARIEDILSTRMDEVYKEWVSQ